jgi:hypothetical protein
VSLSHNGLAYSDSKARSLHGGVAVTATGTEIGVNKQEAVFQWGEGGAQTHHLKKIVHYELHTSVREYQVPNRTILRGVTDHYRLTVRLCSHEQTDHCFSDSSVATDLVYNSSINDRCKESHADYLLCNEYSTASIIRTNWDRRSSVNQIVRIIKHAQEYE